MSTFNKWKNGFVRKCRNTGKIWFCSPEQAKNCTSSKDGLGVCASGSSCDRYWRERTRYFGKMLDERCVIKEQVEFT